MLQRVCRSAAMASCGVLTTVTTVVPSLCDCCFLWAQPLGGKKPHLPARHVVFASSFRVSDKLCVINCDTGEIYLKLSPGRDWPLAPGEDVPGGAQDSLLR